MSSPYEIAKGPEQPRLPGSVVLRETLDDLLDAVCADIHLQANGCVREFGDFQFVISPSPEVERALTRLMIDPNYREFPWSRTRVWIADEDGELGAGRAGDGRATMAGLLLGHAGLPEEQLHGFFEGSSGEPGSPQSIYEKQLRETLGWREKGQDRPDFALVSLGPGGGVAGLVSGDLETQEPDRLATRSTGGRLTVTLPFLNANRFIGVIAVGDDREEPLRSVAEPVACSPCPAARLEPIGGELRWYLDHAACGSPAEEPR